MNKVVDQITRCINDSVRCKGSYVATISLVSGSDEPMVVVRRVSAEEAVDAFKRESQLDAPRADADRYAYLLDDLTGTPVATGRGRVTGMGSVVCRIAFGAFLPCAAMFLLFLVSGMHDESTTMLGAMFLLLGVQIGALLHERAAHGESM